MPPTRKDLAQHMLKADEIRDRFDIPEESAVNVFDLCGERFDPPILVRFTDIKSMEGLYLRQENPEIWLGERPLVRRVFNCTHELGHHVFGHGSTVDELTAEGESGRSFEPNEFLVDTFAGFLLMPRIAVMNAFSRRGWKAETADPEQFFVVSCSLGVGYETLVSHCFFSLNLIGEAAYQQLSKRPGLPAIRRDARRLGPRPTARGGHPPHALVRRHRGRNGRPASGGHRGGDSDPDRRHRYPARPAVHGIRARPHPRVHGRR